MAFYNLSMDKKSLRKEINNIFCKLTMDEIKTLSQSVSQRIMKERTWSEAEQILIFLSFGKEFETEFIIESALNEEKLVAVPRIYGKEMKFHYLTSLDDLLETNRWGIREPLSQSAQWNQDQGNTVMLSPGLAFGPEGSRLGRGGGYYDRFLSQQNDKLQTIGLCFESQFRKDIPMEDYDRRLNGLCTEKRFILF